MDTIGISMAYQLKAIFVRLIESGKIGETSWVNAYWDLRTPFSPENKYGSGKKIWVFGGGYSGFFSMGSNSTRLLTLEPLQLKVR
jgi:hypothetical protein